MEGAGFLDSTGHAYDWSGLNHDCYCTKKLDGGLRLQLLKLKH